jgi:hypothetical protein
VGGVAQPRQLDEAPAWPEKPVMAGEKPASDARKARLAKALKANIAKRKAQARAQEKARAEDRPAGEAPAGAPPDEEGCPN